MPQRRRNRNAAVYDKITWKRKSGNTVNWERVREEEEASPIRLLNSFTCLSVDPERERYEEMAYTPEAATFFYKMMLSLCRLAIELDGFFSSPQKLTNAIREGRLLAAPTAPPQF